MTKTAFVLAGGGSLGSIQVGMLQALEANGIKPDLIVGSSVGAINGAYYAGAPTAEGVERLRRIWIGLRRNDIFPIGLDSLLGLFWSRSFLVNSHGLRNLLRRHLEYGLLEEARVPMYVVATDLLSGEAVALAKGSVEDAIIASSAIPAAFAPVRLDERYLVDGAVATTRRSKLPCNSAQPGLSCCPLVFVARLICRRAARSRSPCTRLRC